MKPITCKRELAEVRSLPRAIVFFSVNWAFQAGRSKLALEELAESLNYMYPACAIPIYIVDLSDQEGEIWDAVREWLQSENRPVDQLTYGGYGALLWVVSGTILVHKAYAADSERGKLLAATRSIFGLSDMNASISLIAHGRSGDKGNHANVAVIAYTPAGFAWLREHLTADRVGEYFAPLNPSRVERFAAPNLLALNFLLHDVLAGGASRSLRSDTQGKTLALALLQMPVALPADHAAMLRPAP
jgi:hypothetical protein